MSTGISSRPSARIVTPDPPVNAVKNAQPSTVATAAPPRQWPVQAVNRRTRRFDAPLSASR